MSRPCVAAHAPTAGAWRPPPGACDTHAHVIGPFDRFPLAASRPYTPPEAPVERLTAMLDCMGFDRVVVAHVSAHGTDLGVTLDALARLGDRARGVAMLEADVSDERLQRLHDAGIRGMRLSHAYGLDLGINEPAIRTWAARIAPLGWHIAMWPQSLDEFEAIARVARDIAVPLVIDHLGNHAWDPRDGLRQHGFALLVRLIADGDAWIKLSAPYRAAAGGHPWRALQPFAAALVEANAERVLYASDWPHVGLWDAHEMPTSGQLLDWLPMLADDPVLQRTVLVDNPAALYGFPTTSAASTDRRASTSPCQA